MTEEAKKKASAKKPAVKAEKPEVKSAAKAEVKTEKKAPSAKGSGATLTVTQTGSPIGRQGYQRATLIGLGLNKIDRTRTLQDTPSIRGMIAKVKHLVKVAGE